MPSVPKYRLLMDSSLGSRLERRRSYRAAPRPLRDESLVAGSLLAPRSEIRNDAMSSGTTAGGRPLGARRSRPSVLAGRARLPVRTAERRRRRALRLRRPRAGLRRLVPVLRRARRATLHDVPDLMLVDRLVLHQSLGHHVELRFVGLEDFLGLVVGRIDQLAHLLV